MEFHTRQRVLALEKRLSDLGVGGFAEAGNGASVTVSGNKFAADSDAMARLAMLHSVALAAILAGAKQGDLRWADPDVDFSWPDVTGQRITMDAETAREFAETVFLAMVDLRS